MGVSLSLLPDNLLHLIDLYYNDKISFDEFVDKSIDITVSKLLHYERKSVYVSQMKILHDVLVSLDEYYRENLSDNLTYDEFLHKFYYSISIALFKTRLMKLYHFITRIIRNVIKEVKNQDDPIIYSYFLIYPNSTDILRSDILFLFLRYIVPAYNPISISSFKEFYLMELRTLVTHYLKVRVEGIVDIRTDFLIRNDDVEITSNRLQIYDSGYKEYYVQLLCSQSDTVRKILRNFSEIKSQVIDNELQVLFFKYLCDVSFSPDLYSYLYMHDNNSLDLSYIKENFPLIYKLLRSVKIRSNEKILNDEEVQYLRNRVSRILSKKFSKAFKNSKYINEIIGRISTNLCNSMSKGTYLDPLTLNKTTIVSEVFIKQFCDFLIFLLFKNRRSISDDTD